MDNSGLNKGKKEKNDEFYTQYVDIEKELKHYDFSDKIVYCNCDTADSNFVKYFQNNPPKQLIYTWDDFRTHGDLLEKCDVIVTNPPFSLFREYVDMLMRYEKKFLIIGNINALSYKEFFPLIRDNKVWLGCSIHSGDREFQVPDSYPLNASGYRIDENGNKYIRAKGVRWFTNMGCIEPQPKLELKKHYSPAEYPSYDNYNAIEVSHVKDIPLDYKGVMGVPISFLDKYNPDQFEIVGLDRYIEDNPRYGHRFTINGKEKYARILIKHKT